MNSKFLDFKSRFYDNGKDLYNKNAANWNMCIFYESVNTVYGYINYNTYALGRGDQIDNDKKDTFIYIPDDEFFRMINENGMAYLSFNEVFSDARNHVADRTSMTQKIKYKWILEKQVDLNPSSLKTYDKVHPMRKELIKRWCLSFYPYILNFKTANNSFFPGIISSHAKTLYNSITILINVDNHFGITDEQLVQCKTVFDRMVCNHL